MMQRTPTQLALQARVIFEIAVIDRRGALRHTFTTCGHRNGRRGAQLEVARIAAADLGGRVVFTRRPLPRETPR